MLLLTSFLLCSCRWKTTRMQSVMAHGQYPSLIAIFNPFQRTIFRLEIRTAKRMRYELRTVYDGCLVSILALITATLLSCRILDMKPFSTIVTSFM